MESLASIIMGIGLSAACGFRVFVPLLCLSVFAFSGQLTLAPSFAWLGTFPALITLVVATVLEIAAYYIPWIDNLMDTIASPTAVVAGVISTASCITGMDPLLQWGLAAIAGGGSAGLVQGATVITRGLSTAGSGGLANPLISTVEGVFSLLLSLLAIVLPFLALGVLAVFVLLIGRQILKWWRTRAHAGAGTLNSNQNRNV